MPYYQCPKCSGRDTYEGTELVSGSSGGGAIIGPENALGMSPVVGVGGRTTTNEQTVVKCKVCDINLGQKDIHLTAEDLAKNKQEEVAKDKNIDTIQRFLLYIFIGIIVSPIVVLIIAAFLSYSNL
jgi:hypothetical protein